MLNLTQKDLQKLFWNNVNKTDSCWLWTGPKSNGYGSISVNNRSIRAYRISYELHKGEIPKGGLICHKCNVRLCVNPDHLYLGSVRDNAIQASVDGLLSGRNVLRGDDHYRRKHITCSNGHTWSEENTLWIDNGNGTKYRRCRICDREKKERRKNELSSIRC